MTELFTDKRGKREKKHHLLIEASYNVVKSLQIEWVESIFKNPHSQSIS